MAGLLPLPGTPSRRARVPARALAALLLFVPAAILVFRPADPAASQIVPTEAPRQVLRYHFRDLPDGGIEVRRAADGVLVHRVAPQTNGFLRGTLRALVRERRRRGIGPELPVELIVGADGRLLLDDPATGWHTDLGAFGPTNAAAFAPLLPPS